MIAFHPRIVAEPVLLLGLVSVPALWWQLRVMPPRPRRIEFPPTRLLFDIAPKEETPSRTPWWLTALRLLAARVPALATKAQAAVAKWPQRSVAVSYGLGFHGPFLFPKEPGTEYVATPYLEALQEHRNDFSVISGISPRISS